MYYAGAFIPKHYKAYFKHIREIRDSECIVRNPKARKNMEEIKKHNAKDDPSA
jgi:hypothetical protein